MESLYSECSHKAQGNFHVHPDVGSAMQILKKGGKQVPFKDVRDIYLGYTKDEGIPPNEPSHGDLLTAVTRKYENIDLGTTCIASDAIPNEIECWSFKNRITKEYYERAKKESDSDVVNDAPHDWIKPLFIKETIKLK